MNIYYYFAEEVRKKERKEEKERRVFEKWLRVKKEKEGCTAK